MAKSFLENISHVFEIDKKSPTVSIAFRRSKFMSSSESSAKKATTASPSKIPSPSLSPFTLFTRSGVGKYAALINTFDSKKTVGHTSLK